MTQRETDDERLREILDELDENELIGLQAGMLPARYMDDDLSGADVARLMDLHGEEPIA